MSELRDMVDKAHPKLSITSQCNLLGIHKSGIYYAAKPENPLNLKLMRLIDEHYLNHPHMGVPSMTEWLRKDQDHMVNPKRVARLYRLMGLQSMAPGPHTSKGDKSHKKYPYLLRGLSIERVNQVWSTDITYIPMRHGFMYLMAVIDIRSRYIVGWSLSNTMEAEWCTDTMEDCMARHGCPEIVNTDQGSQFTSEVFTGCLLKEDVKISMDGKGRATDNIFIERFWRSLKYEDVYLKVYSTGESLHLGLIEYINYYNDVRRHSSLEYQRPTDVFNQKTEREISGENKKTKFGQPASV